MTWSGPAVLRSRREGDVSGSAARRPPGRCTTCSSAAFPEAPRSLFVAADGARRDVPAAARAHRRGRRAHRRLRAHLRPHDARARRAGARRAASAPSRRSRTRRGAGIAVERCFTTRSRRCGATAWRCRFLFTGIPASTSGSAIASCGSRGSTVDAAEAAALPMPSLYQRARRSSTAICRRCCAIYRSAIGGHDRRDRADAADRGVTRRAGWARRWATVSSRSEPACRSRTFASRCRTYGHQMLEAEHLHGHDAAIASLLVAVGARAAALAASHSSRRCRTTTRWRRRCARCRRRRDTTDVPLPDDDARDLARGAAARRCCRDLANARGGSSRRRRSACDCARRTATMRCSTSAARVRALAARRAATSRWTRRRRSMPCWGSGGRVALAAAEAAADVARRIDALFPRAALHFWDSDRI